MSDLEKSALNIREMDELAAYRSPIHMLNPVVKLLVTIAYILITVSFDKYNLTGFITMILYPAIIFALSGISIITCIRKTWFMLIFVCMVGVFNPIFDRGVAGWISMGTLMIKGVFCIMASFLLVATTSVDAICLAFRTLHLPKFIVSHIMLTYRYISVMVDEVYIMTTAYKLRAPGQKGIHYKAWGSFLGQLMLRSMDKAENLYNSMELRGFNGEFYYTDINKAKVWDYLFFVISIGCLILFRMVNVADILGSLMV